MLTLLVEMAFNGRRDNNKWRLMSLPSRISYDNNYHYYHNLYHEHHEHNNLYHDHNYN